MKNSLFHFSWIIGFAMIIPAPAVAADRVSIIFLKITENITPEFLKVARTNLKEYQRRARYAERLLSKQTPSSKDWSDMQQLVDSVGTSAEKVLPSRNWIVQGWIESETRKLRIFFEKKDWIGLGEAVRPILRQILYMSLTH